MSIAQCAAAALLVFPQTTISTPLGAYPLPVVMVAVAGAETGGTWRDDAAGDAGYDTQYGTCDGFTSWGQYQIHNVHAAYLRKVTGSADPCAWAAWLYDPVHCATAAAVLLGSDPQAGLQAWSTWGNAYTPWAAGEGPWSTYLPDAQAAVTAAQGNIGGGGVSVSAPTVPPAVPIGAAIALLVGGVVAVEAGAFEAIEAAVRLRRQRRMEAAR